MSETAKQAEAAAGGPDPAASLTERMLAENAIGETWRICYLANTFVFPLYARLEKEQDLLRPEFVTMYCLAHHEPLIAQDIVQMTALPKNTISRGVKRLLSRGLISRGGHPEDRRKAQLRLTQEGRALVEALMPDFITQREDLVGALTPAERAQLGRLLLKMAQAVARRNDSAGERPARS